MREARPPSWSRATRRRPRPRRLCASGSKFPIIAMEPAVKPAVTATRSGVVGVLATVGTIESARFAALLEQYAGDVEIVTQACPGLVEQVEAGELDERRDARARRALHAAVRRARRRHHRARLHPLSVLAAADRRSCRPERAAHRHGRGRREAGRAPAAGSAARPHRRNRRTSASGPAATRAPRSAS